MAGKITSVIGIYPTDASLEIGVQALKNAGFPQADISVLYSKNQRDKGSANPKGEAAPEGAATGASTGAVVGGVLGWLAGIGSLAIPGVGIFIVAGPIIASLAGAGAGGLVGGIAGGLVGLGVPADRADSYQHRVRDGGSLLSVHSRNAHWSKRAQEILEGTGAQDISLIEEASDEFDDKYHHLQRSA